jgi:uncharacterized protein (TIGR03437 family)
MAILAILPFAPVVWAQNSPVITLVANAEGGQVAIAPNTWVEVLGLNLAPSGDTRVWQAWDFVNGQVPAKLDGVSVTVNGKSAYLYYISPTQINVLTPPDAPAKPTRPRRDRFRHRFSSSRAGLTSSRSVAPALAAT